jgi:serine protease Do
MNVKGVDRPIPATTSRDRSTLAWLTGPVKLVALAVGAMVSVVALMSLVGLVTDNVWIELGAALVIAVGVPLVAADRLLPNDGSPRPGLVTDVLALMWMAGATAVLVLGTTMLQGPLEQQALRFDAHGWTHAAWGTRWAASVPTPVVEPVVEPSAEVAVATEPTPVSAPAEPTPVTPAPGAEFTPAPKQAKRDKLAPAAIFKAWAPSVVTITVDMPFGSGTGTGFVIDDRGTIATNHHVIDQGTNISVKLFDGTKAEKVELLESNPGEDLAVLRIAVAKLPPPVALGESDAVEVGEAVVVIGNPIGLEHTMTDGLVSSRRLFEGKKYIQMSAPVSPGNSGGPVFNEFGDVIGVTVAKLHGENLNLAIPIDVLKPMIKSEYPAARGFGSSRW